MSGPELARWMVIAVLVIAGIAAALWLAPGTPPLAPPAQESAS